MKGYLHKIILSLAKIFNINLCVLYTRVGNYTKKQTGGENGFKDPKKCPFCKENPNIIKVNKYTYVIKNLHPYPNTDDHILLVPKRHIRTWKELTQKEFTEIQENIDKYLDKDYILLGRQYTKPKSRAGASVYHLHIHFILRK